MSTPQIRRDKKASIGDTKAMQEKHEIRSKTFMNESKNHSLRYKISNLCKIDKKTPSNS